MRGEWMGEFARDARVALRAMRRTPLFALLLVGTLAIGIGASTAVWALIDGIVLRPLAYAGGDRLYVFTESTPQGRQRLPSYQAFLDWKREAHSLDRLSFARGEDIVVPDRDGPRRYLAAYVTPDFFPMLGIGAERGRTFGDSGGSDGSVVISWTTWQSQFGGDPNVVGATLRTLDAVFTVAGVMPRTFREPAWADVWIPFDALPARSAYVRTQRNLHVDAQVLARVAPGVSLGKAQDEVNAIARRIAEAYPDDAREYTSARLDPMRDTVLGDATGRLRMLAVVVALVLLVTCLNVAGLLLARHAGRSGELALRAALGARTGRLLRQLLVESAVLAAAGSAVGIIVASLALEGVQRWVPSIFPRLDEVALDARALVFTVAVAAVATIVLGVLPARAALRLDAGATLKRGSVGAPRTRLRHALVALQLALALCVAVGAGLLARTMSKLGEVRLGLDPEGIVALRVFPPERYDSPEAASDLYRRLREETANVAGVEAVALANHLPFSGGMVPTKVVTPQHPSSEDGDFAAYRTVSPEYLRVMRGTVTRGRFINDGDLTSVGSGIVVSETFVRRFLPKGDPVGSAVTVYRAAQSRADLGAPITATVVGVLEDERIFGPGADPIPVVYIPYTWNVWPNIYVVARSTLSAERIVPALQRAVFAVDPEIPVAGSSPQSTFRPLTAYLDGVLQSRRVSAWALSVFAAVTTLLAAFGIFGVMAYLVVQSAREIGVRLALGATPGDVRLWVMWRALQLAGAGVALGLVLAAAGVRVLRSQLVGVATSDPLVYVGVAAALAGVSIAAALLPAMRAARVDPMRTLRSE